MATTATTPDLSTLTDDGDTLVLDGGRVLVLCVEPDTEASVFDDGDWHGDLKWGQRSPYTDRSVRPDDFDGGAEKILTDNGDALWWQPPADAIRDADLRSRLRSAIVSLYHYGYNVVTLELHETVTDSTGQEHDVQVRSASVGMVDLIGETTADDAAHVQEILADLVHEVLADIEKCETCNDTVAACEAEASTWS